MPFVIAAAQSASLAGNVAWNVAHHREIAAVAVDHGVELLVFPELSLTGYELELGPANAVRPEGAELDPLRRLASDARMTLVVGGPHRSSDAGLNIAAFVIRPDGKVHVHTKEYVHESEQHIFSAGAGGPGLRVGDAAVALAICRDASYPEHAARAAGSGAAVYAVGAMIEEEAYPRKSALLRQYAARHGMTVLLSNYSGETGGLPSAGKSAIWDDGGEQIAAAQGDEESLVIATLHDATQRGIVVRL